MKKCKTWAMAVILIIALSLSGSTTVQGVGATEASDEKEHIGGGYAITGQLSGMGYMAKIYDASNGLPTSEANCVMGSSDGYVWIGGYSGIIRYDGSNFERLSASEGLTNGRFIFEDSQKRLWVATNDNGVVVLDKKKTTHFQKGSNLASSSIRAFAEDKDGNVFIGSTAGVSYVDKDLNLHLIDDARINNERILKLESDNDGHIYAQTKTGIICSISTEGIDELYDSKLLGLGVVNTILWDRENHDMLYFGTDSGTLYYGKLGDKAEDMKAINVEPLTNTHWLSYDCDRVWVSSEKGIGYLDKSQQFHLITDLPMDGAIEMTAADYQGNIWVASSKQGVMKIVSNRFANYTELAGIPDEVVNVTARHGNTLYVGTDSALYAIGVDGRAFTNKLTEYIGKTRVRHIFSDSKGNIWVSTFNNGLGLIRYDSGENITAFTTENGMLSNEIRCAFEMKDGRIMVGSNGGLNIIKGDEIVRSVGSKDGIKNTVFLTICEGDNGEIYAGTDGDGLYIIKDDEIKTMGTKDGITSDVIMRIKKDEERGVYWLITSNSIQYIKGGRVVNITSFPYNNCFDIFPDKNNNLWVLSSGGIYSVNASEMLSGKVNNYRFYNMANGLTSVPIAHSYSHKDDDGNLYIAGQSGVSKVNMDYYFEREVSIRTDVSRIYYNDNEILPDELGTYVIPKDSGRMQICPAILDYSMSNPWIKVYLEGAEDAGITASRDKIGQLEYTGLAYGDYKFHIQVLDSKGEQILSDKVFHIKKEPKFFEMLSVKILIALFVAALVAFIVWRIMRSTVIRRQYVEIANAKAEAERANLAKSRFLANMSHEIRTPISTIMGMNEMILRENADGVPMSYFQAIVGYGNDINDAAEALLGIINDVLDISKIESGKMHLVEKEYNTEDMLHAIITMIKVRSDSKGLYFKLDIDKALPKVLYGDEGKIRQIILNLLTNAVKYTGEGGFTLKVKVEEKTREECSLRISVKDTGIGVKEEDMDKLFNAYERLDERQNSGIQGTGLGLDISRQFTELMGGRLWCESVYGHGSEFIFTLKQKIEDPEEIGEFNQEDEFNVVGPYVPKFTSPEAKVLVVDDNKMNLTVIKALLAPTKVQVTTAESGYECLELLKENEYHIVLLDHMMPGMDGVETLAEIRKTLPDLPVYALTANAAAGGEKYYTSVGFNGYLSKPIDTKEVEATIMKHLPEDIVEIPEPMEGFEGDMSLPENLEWVKAIDEIDIDEGIKNSGGGGAFEFSLKLFYDTIDNNSAVIEKAYNEEDYRLFTVKVHALKTSFRIIGCQDMAARCQKMENAGNDRDIDYIKDNTPKLIADYRAFTEKLAPIQKGGEVPAEDKEPVSPEDLKESYEAIRGAIPQMDYDTVEMVLDSLKDFALPKEDEELVAELSDRLAALDWEAMGRLMGE
jgi:signal transduction histidine kinase/ligand-binding sensor domain-containing protein/ActR/RegA family two-component response regulator/HPt (histidine-containing phosphotransfer) domain-containing protein